MKRTTIQITALVASAFLIMLVTSCKKKPTACMTFETTNLYDSIYVAKPVFFKSCSENESHLKWTMGTGSEFTNPVVDYAFETPGIHTVTLQVWNDNDNNTATITNQLLVYP